MNAGSDRHSAASGRTYSARSWIAAALVIGLCFAIMVRNLDTISLWNDETWTVDATDPGAPLTRMMEWLREDVHPPLYFVELYIWRQVTGQSAFELRYFSVLITLLTAAVIAAAGRALFSPAAGWIAALFFALHDLVLVYTQEVRHYSQLMLLAALAIWLYWRFWQRPTQGRGVAFALAGAALIWTHYWGGFVLLALAFHAVMVQGVYQYDLTSGWAPLRPFASAFGAIGVLFLLWVPSLLYQMTVERPGGLPHSLENSWTVFESLAFVLVGVPEVLWMLLAAAGAVGIGLLKELPLQGRLRVWRVSSASALPALVVVFPVGLTVLLNVVYPSLSPRSLAVIIPALALLIGRALAGFGGGPRVIMVVFMVWYGLTTTSAIPTARAPWPEVGEFLADHSAGRDVILLELKNGAWNNLEEYTLAYYFEQSGGNVPLAWSEAARLEDPAAFPSWLDDQLTGVDGVWVVKWGWPESSLRDNLRGELRARGFVLSADVIEWESFSGEPVETWRFDRLPVEDVQADQALSAEVAFDDVLALVNAEVSVHADSDVLTVNLLWTPTAAPDHDYTVSVFLLDDAGVVVAQHDSYPFEGRSLTGEWMPGRLYFDSHALDVGGLPAVEGSVGVKVYHFTDATFSEIAVAPASDCGADPACEFAIVETVAVD